MRSLLRFIVIFSTFAAIGYCGVLAFKFYNLLEERDALNVELKTATDNLLVAENKLKEIKSKSSVSVKPTILRSVVADFLLLLDQLPEEISVANVDMDSDISKTEKNKQGLPYLPVSLTLNYTDYAAAVAIVLDFFAYSPLSLTLESMVISADNFVLNIHLYGVPNDG